MLEGTKLGSVNTCGLKSGGNLEQQDKEGMCEQIQREGVTKAIACEGKRLQTWCRETGKPGERKCEGITIVGREANFSNRCT